ncbi:hypothetical protein EKE94_06510 [Mesobaculum littorinae]|uniref:HPt domain-containing protein n=1 Tax=Mesobaculum littorinae TaxID=2486419 RepID=A0A438AII3_9RHOB|nr:Hpt domain-containing protein [Mesobaculum littorinae]RVV98563.1 hypothetical protein EKE94_06510 [Mesobaculum littorinae]
MHQDIVLERLRARFIDRIAKLKPDLGDSFEAARHGRDVTANLTTIMSESHRIAGLAGSFAFEDLGASASDAETAIRHVLRGNRDREALSQMMKSVRAMLDRMAECLRENEVRRLIAS